MLLFRAMIFVIPVENLYFGNFPRRIFNAQRGRYWGVWKWKGRNNSIIPPCNVAATGLHRNNQRCACLFEGGSFLPVRPILTSRLEMTSPMKTRSPKKAPSSKTPTKRGTPDKKATRLDVSQVQGAAMSLSAQTTSEYNKEQR